MRALVQWSFGCVAVSNLALLDEHFSTPLPAEQQFRLLQQGAVTDQHHFLIVLSTQLISEHVHSCGCALLQAVHAQTIGDRTTASIDLGVQLLAGLNAAGALPPGQMATAMATESGTSSQESLYPIAILM